MEIDVLLVADVAAEPTWSCQGLLSSDKIIMGACSPGR